MSYKQLKLLSKTVFKVSAFRLDTREQTGAPLSDCRINIQYGCLAAHAQNANDTVLDPSPVDGRGRFISYVDRLRSL